MVALAEGHVLIGVAVLVLNEKLRHAEVHLIQLCWGEVYHARRQCGWSAFAPVVGLK